MNARLLLLLALVFAPPLAAQRAISREDARTTLRGVVVDALRGDPLPNAMIRVLDARRGALTDSLGRFVIADLRVGTDVVGVKQYGYEEIDFEIDLREDHPVLRIELEPGPIALEGFEVVADRLAIMEQRLRNRANAAPVSVRTMDQGRLMRTGARDMREMLWFEAGLTPAVCSMRGFGGAATSFRAPPPGSAAMGSCVYRRGRATEPRVYIDEGYTIGGLDELATYPPSYFYRVEVFSSGLEIRAYSHWFMERMAQRPVALIPINLP